MYCTNVMNVTDTKKFWDSIGETFDRTKKNKNLSNTRITRVYSKTVNIFEESTFYTNICIEYFSKLEVLMLLYQLKFKIIKMV